LFPYYQRLINYKKTLPALYGDNYAEISVSPGANVFGFRRWEGDQNVFTVLNMGENSVNATINIPVNQLALDSIKTYYLTDLISGTIHSGIPGQIQNINVSMPAFSAAIYLLADSAIFVSVDDDIIAENLPTDFYINQNYPNPFNPVTVITFNLPEEGNTELIIYDVLGSKITTLFNEIRPAGLHRVDFDGSGLSSGIYFYRVNYKDHSLVRKMLLVK
jgi:hypothetical protein